MDWALELTPEEDGVLMALPSRDSAPRSGWWRELVLKVLQLLMFCCSKTWKADCLTELLYLDCLPLGGQ